MFCTLSFICLYFRLAIDAGRQTASRHWHSHSHRVDCFHISKDFFLSVFVLNHVHKIPGSYQIKETKQIQTTVDCNDTASPNKWIQIVSKGSKTTKKAVGPQIKMICNKNIWKCYFNSGRKNRDLNAIFIQNTLNLITTKSSIKMTFNWVFFYMTGHAIPGQTGRTSRWWRELKDEDWTIIEMSITWLVGRDLLKSFDFSFTITIYLLAGWRWFIIIWYFYLGWSIIGNSYVTWNDCHAIPFHRKTNYLFIHFDILMCANLNWIETKSCETRKKEWSVVHFFVQYLGEFDYFGDCLFNSVICYEEVCGASLWFVALHT